MFSPGIEPGTFRVLGGCDNHYTTKTGIEFSHVLNIYFLSDYCHIKLAVSQQIL